jgi:Fe-S cluster assembly protein SufD
LPNRRVEAWKYTDLRAAAQGLPAGSVPPLGEGDDVITQLADGAGALRRLTVPAGAHETQRVELGDGPMVVRADLIELGAGAQLDRIVIQRGAGISLAQARVRMAEGARFRQFSLAEGGRLARLETRIEAHGPACDITLDGLYMVDADRHADLTSVVEAAAPRTTARQLVKGVARAGGRGVFQGRIVVARPAQKTDARQYHHALLLEEGAQIDAKPELEIYADDVACAHGNTAGALDPAALFYLRARGLPLAQAQAMLTAAFLREALPEWLTAAEEADLTGQIGRWLGAGYEL